MKVSELHTLPKSRELKSMLHHKKIQLTDKKKAEREHRITTLQKA
jgi:hypothetical protein